MNKKISLKEITEETLIDFLKLKVAEGQDQFVAPNAVSIAQAHFSDKAWFRGIYADDTPVGFIMVSIDKKEEEYFLWRLMIGKDFQRMGYGKVAVLELIEFLKNEYSAKKLLVSCVPKDGGPEPFYAKLGFVPTGEYDDGEKIMILDIWKNEIVL